MEKIHIFTDSSADIPPQEVEKYGIEVAPVSLSYQGRTLREYYDVTPSAYCTILETEKEIPFTAMITPTQFLDTYNRAFARNCTHILGILINGSGSGTYQAACLARDLFQQEHGDAMKIVLLDSQTYTYLYGHIVVLAAKMRDHGDSFEAIVSVAKSRLRRVEAFLGVYDLKYLKKSGRISGGASFVGEALGLKPISHVCAGEVTVCDKVRGEKALLVGLLRNVKKNVVQPEKQTAYLLYGDVADSKAAELEQALLQEIGFVAVQRGWLGPSVLTNTGPYAIAVAFFGALRKDQKIAEPSD